MNVPSTEGWQELMKLVGPTSKQSIGSLARALGVLPQLVHKWVIRRQRPRIEHRMGLERVAKIPVDSWLTESERAIAYGTATQQTVVVRDEDVPEYDPAVDEPSPEEVAS